MIVQQLIRYGIIGLSLNAGLYGAYLLLTRSLMGSHAAMTITYCSGVLIGFLLNRQITFRYKGGNHAALLRYIASYAFGYLLNWMAIWFFVDRMGLPHELVQGGVILALAVLLFILQRFWVFPQNSRSFTGIPVRSVS